MPSPFPGMDPYLEEHWLDVHTSLVSGVRDMLNAKLPQDLIASAEERIAVESESRQMRSYAPDVRLLEIPSSDAEIGNSSSATAVMPDTYRLLAQIEPIIERFIRVVDARTERLITVIEFISPTNKTKDGLYAFRAKRGELTAAGVNFVEIDLVRAGDWRALLRPHNCPRKGVSAYRITVRVPSDLGAVSLRPIFLRQRLPVVPIPLRQDDPLVSIDLQELVDRAYVNGRYERRLDYSKSPALPLDEEDAAWSGELIRAAGRDKPR